MADTGSGKVTGSSLDISTFAFPNASSATSTLKATGNTSGISTCTVPRTSSVSGILKDTGTTPGISTVTVAGTSSDISTITDTDTTSRIIVKVPATAPGIGAVTRTNTGSIKYSGTSLGTALVGYIHNVSSVKRIKRNTLNYFTFTIKVEEKYNICGHCVKRIIQVQGLLINCDHCHHKLRASSCPTKLYASIVVKNGSTKLYLSVREEVLQQLLGPCDPDDRQMM